MASTDASIGQARVPSPLLTLGRALPGLVALIVAGLVPLWGVYRLEWSVLAVVLAYIVQTAAAGLFAYIRARQATGQSARPRDDVMISEFFKTYLTVVVAAVLVNTMAFGGRLFKPGGEAPPHIYQPLLTWQYWAIVAVLVGGEAGLFLWDRVRDADRDLPPETFVSAPLRRLFMLQAGAFVLGFIVYWQGSTQTGMALIVVAETAGVVVLAALAALRAVRIRAALDAGAVIRPQTPPKARPRGGRKRRKR